MFASFDVQNVYSCIPVNQTAEIMIQQLQTADIAPEIINEFCKLLTLLVKNNVCVYKNQKHKPDGLSALIDCFEKTVLESVKTPMQQQTLLKYVNHIFCVMWYSSTVSLRSFLRHINKCHPNKNFTLEFNGESISITWT